MPSFTFVATANALLWNGVEPVFCDIDPLTWTLDPEACERVLDMNAAQQLRVIARYTDGREVDVTHTARFQSNNDGVATVTAEGRVPAEQLAGAGTWIDGEQRDQFRVIVDHLPAADERRLRHLSPERPLLFDVQQGDGDLILLRDPLARVVDEPSEPSGFDLVSAAIGAAARTVGATARATWPTMSSAGKSFVR